MSITFAVLTLLIYKNKKDYRNEGNKNDVDLWVIEHLDDLNFLQTELFFDVQ